MISFLALAPVANAQKVRVYQEPRYEAGWNQPTVYPDRIVLNFGADPAREVNVTWRTHPDIKVAYAEIAVATAAPKFWRHAQTLTAQTEVLDARQIEMAEVLAHYHSVRFKNLQPATRYAYRVGDGEHWSEWFQFNTAPAEKEGKFSFLYVGDAQNFILELWSRLIREGFKTAPDAHFFIHAGDLINRAHNDQEWHEWFLAGGFIHSMIPSVPTPGNHEYRALSEAEAQRNERSLSVQWRPQFTLPQNGPEGLEETVYYMDYQNLRLISLNSNRDQEKQVAWLEKVLQNNPQQWTIVTYHHPLYSASEGRDNEKLRNLWKPVFDKYKVDLALQGHDHTYARGRVSPGENLVEGINMRDQTGTVYVVSVSGGKMYKARPDGWGAMGAERDRLGENTQLFQVITIEGERLLFESYTAIGELYDAFTLIKNGAGPNKFLEQRVEAVPEKTHQNTIAYEDQLPAELEKKLLSQHPGYVLNRVSVSQKEGKILYEVRLRNQEGNLDLKLDGQGNVIKE
ncbi:MAG: metallophosphoesterase family protein [Microscillaceae bacterium]|nr:metallophosphoesterase family protein [Microscillaceae bacterium]